MSSARQEAAWKSWPLPTDRPVDLAHWQEGRCAWCGSDRDSLVKDHCHSNGLVRALLCRGCNTAEGFGFGRLWEEYRSGDNPARAIGHFEVYVGFYGTPLFPNAPMTWMTLREQEAWWAAAEARLLSGEWPACDWTDELKARRDAEWKQALAAISATTFGQALDQFFGGPKPSDVEAEVAS